MHAVTVGKTFEQRETACVANIQVMEKRKKEKRRKGKLIREERERTNWNEESWLRASGLIIVWCSVLVFASLRLVSLVVEHMMDNFSGTFTDALPVN